MLAQSRPEGGDSDGEESSQGREEEGGQEKIASRFIALQGGRHGVPLFVGGAAIPIWRNRQGCVIVTPSQIRIDVITSRG
jgi:hypothetical protein